MDTRRKITVGLDFYKQLSEIAKKDKHTLSGMLWIILDAYTDLIPRQKQIEKRILRLEKATKRG